MEDEMAALEAALALLDEFLAPDDSLFAAEEDEELELLPAVASQPKTGEKKRVRDPEVDRRRRQRRRLERDELQLQVEQYELQVAALKVVTGWRSGGESGRWKDAAKRQAQARKEAEETNAWLRAALHSFIDVGARLEQGIPLLTSMEAVRVAWFLGCEAEKLDEWQHGVEQGQPAHENRGSAVIPLTKDYRAVVTTPPHFHSEPTHESMAREVRLLLQDTFQATDVVFGRHGRIDSREISLSSSVWPLHSGNGDCVEQVASTPLQCNFQKSVELLQRWMVKHFGYTINGVSYSDIAKQLSGKLVEVRSNVELGGPLNSTVCRWVSAYERHEDADQVTIVYSTLIAHPDNKLRFQQRGWIVITPSPTNPAQRSLVKTCSHLITFHPRSSVKVREGCGAKSGDPLHHYVYRQLCKRMKYKARDLQSHLLRETGQYHCSDLIST